MPHLMTPDEAASMLQMNPRTLVKWARLGIVPAHPMGEGKRHVWRFFSDELLTWLSQQTNGRK